MIARDVVVRGENNTDHLVRADRLPTAGGDVEGTPCWRPRGSSGEPGRGD
jgi:hypothetical protein